MRTTLYGAPCVAIRLGAVFMAVGLIEQWPRLLVTRADGQLAISAIVLDGLGLLLAFVLWLKPGLLAWWAASSTQRDVVEIDISAPQLQYIAFSVAGIYKFITGLAGMLAHGLNLLVFQHLTEGGIPVSPPTYETTMFAEYVVAAVAGAALTLGARGLTGLLQRLRTAGQPVAVGLDEPGQG
nr:hypothetical protein [Dyella sp. ASV24]